MTETETSPPSQPESGSPPPLVLSFDPPSSPTAAEVPLKLGSSKKLSFKPASIFWCLVYAAVALAGIFLGGPVPAWGKGMLYAAMGLLVFLHPPRRSLGFLFHVLLGALLLIPAAAFLPVLIRGTTTWHKSLADIEISLGSFFTPQPWVTLEHFLALAAVAIWGYSLLARDWDARERRWLLALLLCGLFAAAVAAEIFYRSGSFPTYWGMKIWGEDFGTKRFGPFINRNHFSTILALGSILAAAFAYDQHRRRRKSWLIALGMLIGFFLVLMDNGSRAGILLFFGGLGLWMALVAAQSASITRLALAGSVMLVFIGGFLLLGQDLVGRFDFSKAGANVESLVGRGLIYLDAIRLTGQAPWFGIGLGNFEPVFNISLNKSRSLERALHPESDWLWAATETGLAGVAILAALVWWWWSRLRILSPGKQNQRRDRRFRITAAAGAAIIVIHGIMDVPMHRLAIVLPGLLCAALALGARTRKTIAPFWLTRGARLAGVGIMIYGASVVSADLGGPGWPSETLAQRRYEEAARAILSPEGSSRSAQAEKGVALVSQAIAWRPAEYRYYLLRALALVSRPATQTQAMKDFRRARFLEPDSTRVPAQEAAAWLAYAPHNVVAAWREILQRDPGRAHENFGGMLDAAAKNPRLHDDVRNLAEINLGPKVPANRLRLMLLSQGTREEFAEDVRALLDEDPDLTNFSEEERAPFFRLWWAKGDRDELRGLLREKPAWMTAAWEVLAEEKAATAKYAEAAELMERYLRSPSLPLPKQSGTIRELQKEFRENPTDLNKGLTLYLGYKEAKDWKAAQEVLPKLEVLQQRADPDGFAAQALKYERGVVSLRLDEAEKAWEAFRDYQRGIQ